MAKLLKEYTVRVFDDGSIKFKELKESNYNEILEDCSLKTKQAILVLLQMKLLKEAREKDGLINYSVLYNDAVNLVAENLSITNNSVRDKLERQHSLKASEIQDLIEGFLEEGNHDLKQVLLNSTKNTQKEEEDKIAIEELFKRIKS